MVYLIIDGQPKARAVKLGKKNEDFVIVEEGLAPNDRVALRDPNQSADDIGGLDPQQESSSPQVK